MLYRVIWEIDIDADTPLHAARQARDIQCDPHSCATVFKIKEGNKHIETIDLDAEGGAL